MPLSTLTNHGKQNTDQLFVLSRHNFGHAVEYAQLFESNNSALTE